MLNTLEEQMEIKISQLSCACRQLNAEMQEIEDQLVDYFNSTDNVKNFDFVNEFYNLAKKSSYIANVDIKEFI